ATSVKIPWNLGLNAALAVAKRTSEGITSTISLLFSIWTAVTPVFCKARLTVACSSVGFPIGFTGLLAPEAEPKTVPGALPCTLTPRGVEWADKDCEAQPDKASKVETAKPDNT